MRAITRDPREYRRGMVLGLTLAETLLLLLFLLLLASSAVLLRRDEALREARAASEALRPLLQRLQSEGRAAEGAALDELASRLERAAAAQMEAAELREALQRAEARARAADRSREEAERLAARLQREAAPTGTGADAEAVAARLAEADRRVEEASRMLTRSDEARTRAELEAATHRARATSLESDRDRAVAEGMIAGGVYPSCWRRDGQPEFVFQVNLLTGGRVIVEDRAPQYRREEEAWRLLDAFPRGTPIEVGRFVAATQRMSGWAARQAPACRFWISVRRDMGPDVPNSEYLRVIGPLGNAASRHLPFYRIGG
jgi:hypothetical protein